jgi:ketosteroid isomerase-like protein
MKTILMVSLFVITAFALAGCAPPANTNTTANVNTNTNTASKAAAPTADSLMALENKAWEAYKNKDGKYFETFLGETMINGNGQGNSTKAEVVKMISEHKDEVKSFSLSDPHVTAAGADAAVLTYKATVEGTENGKPIPSPVTVATVFVRSGTDWKAVYHNEVAVIDPAKMSGDATKKEDGAKSGDEKKEEAGEKKADDKKEMPAPSEKKEPAASPAANSNTASNSNSSAASGDAALTDALMVIEKKGWEGWKAKDATALGSTVSKDIVFVDTMGKQTMGADVMKMWTTDNPCNVSSVSLSDGKATSISKDAAILVVKGTAVGTCGDAKLEPLWNTTVFAKEGDAWKAVLIFETPIKKS